MASSFFSQGLHNGGNHRFPVELTRARRGIDEEERREFSRNAIQQYNIKPISPEDSLGRDTKRKLELVWEDWLNYAKDVGVHPKDIWVKFCEWQNEAISCFRSFLSAYIQFSRIWRPSLGPEEWEMSNTITWAGTIEDVWARLVRKADMEVLHPMRKKMVEQTGQWPRHLELRYSSRDKEKHRSPAHLVAKWIPELARENGISLEQGFDKKETSPEDTLTILDVLWTRAKDIDCTPDVRVAFHCSILLAAIGGWRPGCLVDIKYKDVQLAWVRHNNKTHLVATITINHNKGDPNQIQRSQRKKVRFSITTVPCSQICLVSFLASRALADRAFEAEFVSPDQILYPKPLEDGVDYVPLKWKPDMQEKDAILPISYNSYNRLWSRTCFVAGLREMDKMRPYAMRVGTGNRLDGSLTPAIRNYILDHSTEVHEQSYLAVHIKHDIHAIAFPGLTGENSVLISLQSSALLRRDQNAPIYITKDDLNEWEKRNDMKSFREQYEEEKKKDKRSAAAIKARIKYLLDDLEKKKIKKTREAYFEEADRLRAQGRSTDHLNNSNATDPRRNKPVVDAVAASHIGVLLQRNVDPQVTITKVTAYLKRKSEKEILKDSLEPEPLQSDLNVKPSDESRCLLCDFPYTNVSSLTRHVRKDHKFANPFDCPECLRNGNVQKVSGIPSAWSNHVEKFHGKKHTPNLWPESEALGPEEMAYCPICQQSYTARGFNSHYNRHQRTLEFPYDCQECLREGKSEATHIKSPDDWILHVRDVHNGGRIHGAILRTGTCKKRIRKDEKSSRKRLKLESGKRVFDTSSDSDLPSYEWEMSEGAGSHEAEEL